MNRDELIERASKFSGQLAEALLAHDGYTPDNPKTTGFIVANYERFAIAGLFAVLPLVEADLRAEVQEFLDKVNALSPNQFKTGQGHLSPAFREINYRAAFMAFVEMFNEFERTFTARGANR